jgi:hypothetical protein
MKMRIAIAYIVVLFFSGFAFSIGSIPGLIFGLAISWTPKAIRYNLGGLITGISCGLTAITFGWVIFRYIAGSLNYGSFALLATLLPLYFPIRRDLITYREDKQNEIVYSEPVVNIVSPMIRYSLFLVIGEVTGLVIGIFWTLLS